MEDSPPVVCKWDGNAVKNAMDDAVKDIILNRFNYVECHKLLDGRLIISSIAVGFSLFALGWDYFNPFPLSRMVLLTCVVSYFIMMAILTWYTTYMEKGIFCVALNRDPAGFDPEDKWYASSCLKRFEHHYHLSLVQKHGKTGKLKEAKTVIPIEKIFDTNGKLLYDKLSKDVVRIHSDIDHKKN